jgi:outer membrane protein OmpA-like peptidoglycan-associated protein
MNSIKMTRLLIAVMAIFMVMGSACATKKHVRNRINERVAPLEGRTHELEESSRDLNRRAGELENGQVALGNNIRDVDGRATAGINQAKQQAQDAQNQALTAHDEARMGNSRVDNLDTWEEAKQVNVAFKVNQSRLTQDDKDMLDELAAQIKQEKGYLIEIRGFTDATGSPDRNLALSEARAKAVYQYLATVHEIPAHKMNIVGFGKLKPVGENKTRTGRAENRRVEVKLLVNAGIRRTPAVQPSQQSSSAAAGQDGSLRP